MPQCKSCGAPIIWSKTANGKAVPLDAGYEKRFICFKIDDGEAFYCLMNTYSSHLVTCPDAAKHRKRGNTE